MRSDCADKVSIKNCGQNKIGSCTLDEVKSIFGGGLSDIGMEECNPTAPNSPKWEFPFR